MALDEFCCDADTSGRYLCHGLARLTCCGGEELDDLRAIRARVGGAGHGGGRRQAAGHRAAWRFLGLPLPRWLAPGGNTFEYADGGRFCFHVEIAHPLTGLIVRYRGWLAP